MTRFAANVSERIYLNALKIRDGGASGHWLPMMWCLALRGHSDAMIDLADWLSDGKQLGSFGNNFSAAGLYRGAYCKGNSRAAHNLAMTYFNRGDLAGYRHWIKKAGRAGDVTAGQQSSRFECRLPHAAAAKIGRIRTEQKRDEFA